MEHTSGRSLTDPAGGDEAADILSHLGPPEVLIDEGLGDRLPGKNSPHCRIRKRKDRNYEQVIRTITGNRTYPPADWTTDSMSHGAATDQQ